MPPKRKGPLDSFVKVEAKPMLVLKSEPVEAADEPAVKRPKVAVEHLVNPKRVQRLNEVAVKPGPVIYWMSRDQRVADNWALLYALETAKRSGSPVAVAFNLVPGFLHAGARQFGFMLRGMKAMQPKLAELGIPFFLLRGEAGENLPALARDVGAGLVVADYSPIRLGLKWKQDVKAAMPDVAFHVVDAHNVVPVWVVSDKRETAARTIRPKVHRNLPEFLKEYPPIEPPAKWTAAQTPEVIDWDVLIAEVVANGAGVPEVTWCVPGEDAAMQALAGPKGFLTKERLSMYDSKRNDPNADALSNLSPYVHYGQLAAARCALAAGPYRAKYKGAVEGFLEELIVRRELADNFCHYEPRYDSLDAAAGWAIDSLNAHRGDKREYLYTREEWEKAKTHDQLWNAAQLEMVHVGKMHGFMRMYWAKKILEWSASPEEALEVSIWLNDKYELDGRDPNGYVGCMWSVCGIHDQGWAERAVFGKIRYMNYAGCKRKFDVDAYVQRVRRQVVDLKKANKLAAADPEGTISKVDASGRPKGAK